jgi:osmotically-inducible protein OsmY
MKPDQYKESAVQRVLTEDERVTEQGIRVSTLEDDTVALSGEVESLLRKQRIEQVVAERFPDLTVKSDIGVTRVTEPQEVEEV